MASDLSNLSREELLAMVPADIRPTEPSIWDLSGTGVTVIAVILLIASIALAWGIRHWIQNKYRRDALTRLSRANNTTKINEVLKSTAILAFGRSNIASMAGETWWSFLDKHSNDSYFSEHQQLIEHALYGQGDLNIHDFKNAASRFIKRHSAGKDS